jgi:hypothetical protein
MLNNCSTSDYDILLIAIALIGFAVVNEIIVVTAQSNSTNLDKRNIVVTWLETVVYATFSTNIVHSNTILSSSLAIEFL